MCLESALAATLSARDPVGLPRFMPNIFRLLRNQAARQREWGKFGFLKNSLINSLFSAPRAQ
jgi:hypothetical protein